jgi:hypothetical protein
MPAIIAFGIVFSILFAALSGVVLGQKTTPDADCVRSLCQ